MSEGKAQKHPWKDRVKEIKEKTYILYLALKHKDVPWYSKLIIGIVVGYALSPIDFIPDFIPILGYIDDIILLPIGIVLALKTIPDEVKEELEEAARREDIKKSWLAGLIIILIWITIIGFIIYKLLRN